MRLFDAITKSIKTYADNTLDIKRFAVLFQKLNLYIIGICLLIPAVWFNFFDENFINKRSNIFNYKEEIRSSYEDMRSGYEFRKKSMPPYDSYFKNMVKRYNTDFIFIYGGMAITVLPWLLILFWPAGAPIRVDRKNGLIYTRQ